MTKAAYAEDDEYLNGMHRSELPPPWTKDEKVWFKDALVSLRNEGKLSTGTAKEVKANMKLALEELVEHHPDFASYKAASGGPWKKRKYNALYNITKRFTDEYVGTAAGERLY